MKSLYVTTKAKGEVTLGGNPPFELSQQNVYCGGVPNPNEGSVQALTSECPLRGRARDLLSCFGGRSVSVPCGVSEPLICTRRAQTITLDWAGLILIFILGGKTVLCVLPPTYRATIPAT